MRVITPQKAVALALRFKVNQDYLAFKTNQIYILTISCHPCHDIYIQWPAPQLPITPYNPDYFERLAQGKPCGIRRSLSNHSPYIIEKPRPREGKGLIELV